MRAGLLIILALAVPLNAADPSGRWKFRFSDGPQPVTLLLAFSKADGQWTGDFVSSSAPLRIEPQFASVKVTGDTLQFRLNFGERPFINFDGILSKDGKKISGSYSQFGGSLKLTELYPSKLKRIDDPIDLARENVEQLESGPDVFHAGFAVVDAAAGKKIPVEEIRTIADKLAKAASNYGTRWEQHVALRLATSLTNQKEYADVALAQARRAERLLTDDTPAGMQLEIYETLARALTTADKADEAKKYFTTVIRIQSKDVADYVKETITFPIEKVSARKGKGDRVALVEVFTGAECPPCVAVDVATDALAMTYPPTDVIVLQYHFHVPGPDPLTAPDGMERVGYYADVVQAAPTTIVNGKVTAPGGGPLSAAKGKYGELRAVIEPILDQTAPVKIALHVSETSQGYQAKATISDLQAPGEKMTLRFILAEELVRYPGGNGARYHRNVVRAMPGGPRGFPVKSQTMEQTVEFNLEDIRQQIARYLEDYAREERDFPRPDRPLQLRDLKLIALVQNDETLEVLQAAQVDLPAK